MPIGILIAAVIVGLLATYQTRQHLSTVEAHVRELCRLAANGEDLADAVLMSDARLESPTIAAIEHALDGAMPDLSNVQVQVAPGEASAADLRRTQWTGASHHAMILVDGEAMLGLRLSMSDATMNRVVILGYWLPELLDEM